MPGMDKERDEFAARLAAAMRKEGLEPRPSVLFRLFSTNHPGNPVSFQSVSRWLNGRSIPEQDKLQTLARVLDVSPHDLRYGTAYSRRVEEPRAPWPAATTVADREAIEAYLALPPVQRRLIRELIAQLEKANDTQSPT